MRHGQRRQGAHQAAFHLVLQIAVEEHGVPALPQPGVHVGGQAVQVAHLDADVVRARDLGQLVKLALGHVAGGDEQHRRGPRRARQQQQQRRAQPQPTQLVVCSQISLQPFADKRKQL